MKVNAIKFAVSWITLIVIGCFLPNNGNGTFTARTDKSGFGIQQTQNSTGELHYNQYCLSCHGQEGRGDGELSYLLYPKPRDLTQGSFKIRSTPGGTPPTDDDLYRTIIKGLPGTAMPSFEFLGDPQIKSLVSYVKKLGRIDNYGVTEIEIPEVLSPSKELVELGKSIYTEVGCNKCHGETGKGDGSSSNTLIDSWGYPIIPRDFTSGVYLGGGDVKDLYLRFVGGIDGTPMPAYGNLAEAMGRPSEEEQQLSWALIYYVKSLERQLPHESAPPPKGGVITAAEVSRLTQPRQFMEDLSNLWNKSNSYAIPISRLWQSDNVNYQMVNVQALFNSKYIAIKLEWDDFSSEQNLYRTEDFQDGAAIQFSIDGTKGFHGMGSEDHPTDIWFWKAEWQMRVDEKTDSDIVFAYANRVSDSDVDTYPTVFNDVAYLSGRDAGNLNSEPRITSPVENVTAIGPQTVTPLPEKSQTVMGKGTWDGNKWKVVFVRDLKPDFDQKADFNKSESIPIAFAIWNGSENDRNGQKMVSTWYEIELKD